MNKFTYVIVNLRVEGIHFWNDAPEVCPDVAFLQYPHRHMFHICVKKEVSHDDRDVEIIMFKREIEKYLEDKYSNGKVLQFGGKSCEMLATEVCEHFKAELVSVLEDGENGAEVIRINKVGEDKE